jgi:hypothetical protein
MDKKTKASMEIEKLVQDDKELSYLDAVLLWSEANEVDHGSIKKYISASLHGKLHAECVHNNMISDKNNTASMNEFF